MSPIHTASSHGLGTLLWGAHGPSPLHPHSRAPGWLTTDPRSTAHPQDQIHFGQIPIINFPPPQHTPCCPPSPTMVPPQSQHLPAIKHPLPCACASVWFLALCLGVTTCPMQPQTHHPQLVCWSQTCTAYPVFPSLTGHQSWSQMPTPNETRGVKVWVSRIGPAVGLTVLGPLKIQVAPSHLAAQPVMGQGTISEKRILGPLKLSQGACLLLELGRVTARAPEDWQLSRLLEMP